MKDLLSETLKRFTVSMNSLHRIYFYKLSKFEIKLN